MSITIMSQVWKEYPNGGGEMLLALALADHAHDDGKRIYPSIKQLALKTRQSERTVQYQLRNMEASGWIVLVNQGNGGRNQFREYRISPEWLAGAKLAPIENGAIHDKKGATDSGNGATDDVKGATAIAPANNHQEPLEPPKPKREKKQPAQIVIPAVPDWIPVEAWTGYIAMRFEKKKAPTDHAVELLVRSLEKMHAAGHDIGEVINASIRNCWTDVYWPRGAQAAKQTPAISDKYRTNYDRAPDIAIADRLNAAAGVKPRRDDDDPGEF